MKIKSSAFGSIFMPNQGIIKCLLSFGSAFLLSLSSLIVLQAPIAFAATVTWDGGGVDDNFSTAANWSGDLVPSNNDSLVFDTTGMADHVEIVNDLVGASFTSISFEGNGNFIYTISGNSLTLTGGISNTSNSTNVVELGITLSGNQTFTSDSALFIEGILSGSGNLTKAGNLSTFLNGDNSTYSGAVTVSAGTLYVGHLDALGTSASGTTVNDGAQMIFDLNGIDLTTFTIAEPLTLAGDGDGALWSDFALGVIGCNQAGCNEDADVTLSGPITLTANMQFAAYSKVTLTGSISGNYTMAMAKTYPGQIVVNSNSNGSATPNGTLKAPQYTTTYSDDQSSTPITANYNETVVVTGKRQDVYIDKGGILKGTGTVRHITLVSGGKIAPGLSPGCMNTGNLTFVSGSSYDFEVGGVTECTEHDQIKVTGTVDLGSGTLNVIRFNDFKPVTGQTYKIIDNDSNDAITGTFNNLAEGATFTVDGYVLKITYVGGDGNDVVLTVQSVPATPVTGFSLITSNPLVTLLGTLTAAVGIALIARRYNKV